MHIKPFLSRCRGLIAGLSLLLFLTACGGRESGPQSNVASSGEEPVAGQTSPERVTPVIRRAQ